MMSRLETQVWRQGNKIAIIGGGLVGLATTIFLQRGRFAVTVLEKDAELGQVYVSHLPAPRDL